MARIVVTAEEYGERLVDNFNRRMEELRRFGGFVERHAASPSPGTVDVPPQVFAPLELCFKCGRNYFDMIRENRGIVEEGEAALEKLKTMIAEVWVELDDLDDPCFGEADELTEEGKARGEKKVHGDLKARLLYLFNAVGKGKGQILIMSGFRAFGVGAGQGYLADTYGERDSRVADAHWSGLAIDLETAPWRKANGLKLREMDELAEKEAGLWRPFKTWECGWYDPCHWTFAGRGTQP